MAKSVLHNSPHVFNSSSNLSISGSLSGGKSKNDDGTKNTSGSAGGQFATGNSSGSLEKRTGGSVTSGGALDVTSGGNNARAHRGEQVMGRYRDGSAGGPDRRASSR